MSRSAYSLKETAQELGKSYITVFRWYQGGKIKGSFKIGRSVFIPSEWLDSVKTGNFEA